MSKVITFSRVFPSYHPKAGQPTFFVEKFWNSLYGNNWSNAKCPQLAFTATITDQIKHHTIRAGQRFKAGEYFAPKVWGNDINPKSGRKGPYHSKQIRIAPDIQIKKVWDFEIDHEGCINIDGQLYAYTSSTELLNHLAENDGLNQIELLEWFKFPKPFKGQIICWNENINY